MRFLVMFVTAVCVLFLQGNSKTKLLIKPRAFYSPSLNYRKVENTVFD